MRHLTFAAVTLAGFAFTGTAHADSNYGPRQQGNQCWHQQSGNSFGYWAPCQNSRNANAQATQATRSNASSPPTANNNTRRR